MRVKQSTWKLLMSFIAVLIVIGTFFYSNTLSKKISQRERKMVEEWVAAEQMILRSSSQEDISLAALIIAEQQDIPVIETDEKDSVMSFVNLDSLKAHRDTNYLKALVSSNKSKGRFITTYLSADGKKFNRYYYGESVLLKQIRYFPLVQLFIVALFVLTMLISIRNQHRSDQHYLWAGLAKETAHQLGTPISALSGWTEVIGHGTDARSILPEMQKDIERLKLIADRFSMIGGKPKKESCDLVELVSHAVEYIRKRASEKTQIVFQVICQDKLYLDISAPLIEWVVENLLKNALDATDGKGSVEVVISDNDKNVFIDVADTGKGIPEGMQHQIFSPGFTTKKRGWGLGLTLSKRIIEEYHGGDLFVKHSDPDQGTTFRILLSK
ncbi:MAG: sensor histidine kinase [bacterium]